VGSPAWSAARARSSTSSAGRREHEVTRLGQAHQLGLGLGAPRGDLWQPALGPFCLGK
jgi:hypothetical protein